MSHHFSAHGVARPEGNDVVYRVFCLDVFSHAAGVLAQSLGVDHSVEFSGKILSSQDADGDCNVFRVALHPHFLDNIF